MTFQETPRFPEKISFGATGGPTWRTEIAETGGGYEYTNRAYSQPLHTYDVSHAARREKIFAALRAFYMVQAGRAGGFRYKDWADYRCPDDAGVGVFVLLTSTTFQMYKRYTSGSGTWNRKITKPQQFPNAVSVVGGAGVSVSYTTGVVSVSSGTPTAWSGEFDVPCRFVDDAMKAQIIDGTTARRVVGWTGIGIKEIKI
jgi:uncharacterized protein (TIGR02217 family)